MPEAQPVDADILVFRQPNGQLDSVARSAATEEQLAEEVKGKKRRKAEFQYRVKGAQARATQLPRELTRALADGTVNLMLAQVLQQEVVPSTAKEAMDVAKIARDIAASMSGGEPAKNRTAEEVAQQYDEIDALGAALRKRAEDAKSALDGAPPADAVVDDDPEPFEIE